MKKIGVHLILRPFVGGSYQYWYSILQALSSFDRKEYLILGLYYDDEWKIVLDSFNIKGLKLHKEKRNRLFYYFVERAFWKWDLDIFHKWLLRLSIKKSDLREVSEFGFDMIIGDSIDLTYLINARMVVPIHDLMHRYEKSIPEMREGFEYREKMYNRIIPKVDLILTDSELGKKQVIESYGNLCSNLENHIESLPFIAPSYIYDGVYDDSIRSRLPDKYIFYPAQFWSHKNHERLIEAISMLNADNLIVKLVLVGSKNNSYEAVKQRIHDLDMDDQILMLGYVSNEEMVYIYKHARALIYPTLFGPTNIPPLEAFYLECPVGASGIYAMPEQLGDAAVLFNPRSVEEIAETIRILWTDDALCSELVKKGKERANAWGPIQFAERLRNIIDAHIVTKE